MNLTLDCWFEWQTHTPSHFVPLPVSQRFAPPDHLSEEHRLRDEGRSLNSWAGERKNTAGRSVFLQKVCIWSCCTWISFLDVAVEEKELRLQQRRSEMSREEADQHTFSLNTQGVPVLLIPFSHLKRDGKNLLAIIKEISFFVVENEKKQAERKRGKRNRMHTLHSCIQLSFCVYAVYDEHTRADPFHYQVLSLSLLSLLLIWCYKIDAAGVSAWSKMCLYTFFLKRIILLVVVNHISLVAHSHHLLRHHMLISSVCLEKYKNQSYFVANHFFYQYVSRENTSWDPVIHDSRYTMFNLSRHVRLSF